LNETDGLQVLALQQHPAAEPLGEEARLVQRRLESDVVDVRVEDHLQVIDLAHPGRGAYYRLPSGR
jgi:hypothetical protein